jgi:hypothetical protein
MVEKKFNKIDVIVLTLLFLTAFYIWTAPLKDNQLPYGEADESYHFMVGDYQGQNDEVIRNKLPEYIGYRYYDKSALGPFTPMMLPPSHLNLGIIQIIGGDRIVPVFIYEAIVSFMAMFAVYFITRKLFGTIVAAAASFGMIFSFRSYMTYLWGQWPSLTSITIIPITIYVFYKYLVGYFNGEKDNKLLIVLLLLALSQYVLHLQGFIMSALVILVMLIVFSIKYKKIPLGKKNIKWVVIVGGVFLVVFFLTYQVYFAHSSYAQVSTGNVLNFERIFSWYFDPGEAEGYSPDFKSFNGEYGQLLLIPFVLGLIYLWLNRKNDKYLLLVSWLIGIYIALHLDVFLGSPLSRVVRFYIAESQLFFILIILGVMSIPVYFKLNKSVKDLLKLGLIVLLMIFMAFSIGDKAQDNLSKSYEGLARITPQQYELSEWIKEESPEDSVFYIIGTLTYPKERFIHALSMRPMFMGKGSLKDGMDSINGRIDEVNDAMNLDYPYLVPTHIIFDYSDLAYLANNENYMNQINALKGYEQYITEGTEVVYEKDNIRVYKLKEGVYSYE